MKNFYFLGIVLCMANLTYSMEKDIQHLLCKMSDLPKKTISDLKNVIEQISIDLRNPPPQERFEVPTDWKTHMCLWNCQRKFEQIKAATESLHIAVQNNDTTTLNHYLKIAPSLVIFADTQGKTLLEKANGKDNEKIRKILKYPSKGS